MFGAIQQQAQTEAAGATGAPDAINVLGAYLPTIYISKIALDSTVVDRPLVVKDPHIQTVKFGEEGAKLLEQLGVLGATSAGTGPAAYKTALLEKWKPIDNKITTSE